MSRKHEIQAETRPMGESLQICPPPNIPQMPPDPITGLREYRECSMRTQPSAAAQTSWSGCQEGVPQFWEGAGRQLLAEGNGAQGSLVAQPSV